MGPLRRGWREEDQVQAFSSPTKAKPCPALLRAALQLGAPYSCAYRTHTLKCPAMCEFPSLLPAGMECSLPSTSAPKHTKAGALHLCYGLSYVFQNLYSKVLTPSTQECDLIWRIINEIKIKSLGLALIQCDSTVFACAYTYAWEGGESQSFMTAR